MKIIATILLVLIIFSFSYRFYLDQSNHSWEPFKDTQLVEVHDLHTGETRILEHPDWLRLKKYLKKKNYFNLLEKRLKFFIIYLNNIIKFFNFLKKIKELIILKDNLLLNIKTTFEELKYIIFYFNLKFINLLKEELKKYNYNNYYN